MCLFYPTLPKKPSSSAAKSYKHSHSSRHSTTSSTRSSPQIYIHGQPLTSSLPAHVFSGGSQPWAFPQATTTSGASRSGGTNIYLPPTGNGASDEYTKKDIPQARRRSSVLIAEIEGIRRLARRVGDAARRGSASSFRKEEREERRDRRDDRTEKRVVDEEARRLAIQNGEVVRSLVHERDVKIEAERLVDRERARVGNNSNVGFGSGSGQHGVPGASFNGSYQDPWRAGAQGQWGEMGGAGSVVGGMGRRIEFPASGQGNHIHVHTAPLIQGPSISTVQPGAGGAHGTGYVAAGMGGGEQFVGYGFAGGLGRKAGMGSLGGPGREWERERERLWRGGVGAGLGMLY